MLAPPIFLHTQRRAPTQDWTIPPLPAFPSQKLWASHPASFNHHVIFRMGRCTDRYPMPHLEIDRPTDQHRKHHPRNRTLQSDQESTQNPLPPPHRPPHQTLTPSPQGNTCTVNDRPGPELESGQLPSNTSAHSADGPGLRETRLRCIAMTIPIAHCFSDSPCMHACRRSVSLRCIDPRRL